jgi:NAD(P)-dependent dehydrogenase (short-subunit alcohol dehydrogenase family)/acyl carrier protein
LDLSFGLTDGWWRFADTSIRTSHPLLSPEKWQGLLEEAGLEQPVATVPCAKNGQSVGQAVILARKPSKQSPESPKEQADWLVFADRGGVGDQLAQKIEDDGGRCWIVRPGTNFCHHESDRFEASAGSAEHFQRILEVTTGKADGRPLRVVHLWSLDAANADHLDVCQLESDLQSTCGGVVHAVQALAGQKRSNGARLWLITRGTQPVGPCQRVPGIVQAPVWGLGTVVALEHPDLRCVRVDLDPDAQGDDAEALWRLLKSAQQMRDDCEDQIALRKNDSFVPRLVRGQSPGCQPTDSVAHRHDAGGNVCRASAIGDVTRTIHADATYLITGGLGVLGLRTADWLVGHGARHIALVGRTGLPDRGQWENHGGNDSRQDRQVKSILSMEARGAQISTHIADVGHCGDVEELFGHLNRQGPPVRGIIHAAGVSEYRPIDRITIDSLSQAFRAKAVGGWLLMQHARQMALDFYVSYSSTTSLWGTKGQALYAAANSMLDGLTYVGRQWGVPALTVNWGLWAGGGMVDEAYRAWLGQIGVHQAVDETKSDPFGGLADESYRAWMASYGIEELAADRALQALGQLLATETSQVAVAKVDWGRFAKRYQVTRIPSLLRQISRDVRMSVGNEDNHDACSGSLRMRLAEVLPNEREDLLVDHIRGEIARVLGIPAVELDVTQPLNHLGLDSLMAIELRNRIKSELGINLPMVKFMEGASLSELAEYLNRQFVDRVASCQPLENTQTPCPEVLVNQPVNAVLGDSWVEGEI